MPTDDLVEKVAGHIAAYIQGVTRRGDGISNPDRAIARAAIAVVRAEIAAEIRAANAFDDYVDGGYHNGMDTAAGIAEGDTRG